MPRPFFMSNSVNRSCTEVSCLPTKDVHKKTSIKYVRNYGIKKAFHGVSPFCRLSSSFPCALERRPAAPPEGSSPPALLAPPPPAAPAPPPSLAAFLSANAVVFLSRSLFCFFSLESGRSDWGPAGPPSLPRPPGRGEGGGAARLGLPVFSEGDM